MWFYDAATGRKLGLTTVGDLVSGIVWRPAAGGPLAIAGTHAGWVLGLRSDASPAWSVPLPDAVTLLVPVGQDRVAACCEDGGVYLVDADGEVLARGRGTAAPQAAIHAGGCLLLAGGHGGVWELAPSQVGVRGQ